MIRRLTPYERSEKFAKRYANSAAKYSKDEKSAFAYLRMAYLAGWHAGRQRQKEQLKESRCCAEMETRLADVKQANRMANDLLEQALAELKAVTAELAEALR